MGHGGYDSHSRSIRATKSGFYTKTNQEIYTQSEIHKDMNPHGLKVRESRDSDEHPNSIAMVIGLDLTGSMGMVPQELVRDGLPNIMQGVMDAGEPDPQVLFVGVGDHECDRAPLQVGQFESSDELLDKWLTNTFLEGGGGGNEGESYLLAWYLAAYHTSIDCFEKRGKKGFLFTIGDEPTLHTLPKDGGRGRELGLKEIMGPGQHEDHTVQDLLKKVSESYEVYHIHVKETYAGRRQPTIDGWKQLLGDNLIVVDRGVDVAGAIIEIVAGDLPEESVTQVPIVDKVEEKKDEIML